MSDIDTVKTAQLFAPAFFPSTQIVKKSTERGVFCHHGTPRTTHNQIFFHIKPFVDFFENFRFVVLHPFITPNRIFDARRCGSRQTQTVQHFYKTETFDVDDAFSVFLFLGCAPCIHIAHRIAECISVFVYQNKSLHLRTETDCFDIIRVDFGLFQNSFGRFPHSCPPFVGRLFHAAVVAYIKFVFGQCAGNQFDFIGYLENTGFVACRADIVRNNIDSFFFLTHGVFL